MEDKRQLLISLTDEGYLISIGWMNDKDGIFIVEGGNNPNVTMVDKILLQNKPLQKGGTITEIKINK